MLILTLAAGCTGSRHRIVVYDQTWSSAAAVRNLHCAPEVSASCEQESKETEAEFSKRLPAAFQATPECATVQFLVLSESEPNAREIEDSLTKNAGGKYWRLRVDFHPRLSRQPFSLGQGMESGLVGGEDAEHDTAFICKAVKNNGVLDIW
jgi:hypothetical protein